MNTEIVPIMFLVIVWRIAIRPKVLRTCNLKPFTPSGATFKYYLATSSVEIAAAIVVLCISLKLAWLSIAILLVGSELRFWVFNARVPKEPVPQI